VNSLASGATQATPPPSPARSDGLVDSYRRLADVFHEVLSEQTHSTVLERIADSLADVIPYDAFTIYQADEARRLLGYEPRESWPQGTEIVLGKK